MEPRSYDWLSYLKDRNKYKMANASIPLTMTGEQCQHLVNIFVANHAERTQSSYLDRAARKIDVSDEKSPDLTKKWIRPITRLEQGTMDAEFLFSLAQETTYDDLLREVWHWMPPSDEVSS